MVHLTAVTWMPKKETDIAFFIKYWNRDYLVNAIFFQELMGSDLYVCDSYSSILQYVCVFVYIFVHILNKNAVLLSMSWASGKLTRAPPLSRHHSAGHARPCKVWWLDNEKADTRDHILLFPPLLLSLAFFYVIYVKVLSLFFQKFHRFLIIDLSNSVHLLTYFLTTKSLPSASHEPVTLTTFCASPVSSQWCINSQLLNRVWEMTVSHVVWISV